MIPNPAVDTDASAQVATIAMQLIEDWNSETPSHSALEATELAFAGTSGKDIVKDSTALVAATHILQLHIHYSASLRLHLTDIGSMHRIAKVHW